MARRLVKRGVRFVQLYSGSGTARMRTVTSNKTTAACCCSQTDRPIAAFLTI